MRRIVVLVLVLFIPMSLLFSQQVRLKSNNVTTVLNELKVDKDLRNATVGFYAIDLNTNEIIADLNSNLSMKPASTMKLITTAAALETLGADFRFQTKLAYTGKIDTAHNILHGNVIIIGGGDPSLGSKYFSSTADADFIHKWIVAIKKLGIDSIDGNIISDASKYSQDMVPPTWSWEDIGNYFGAGACGLTCFDNLYTLYYNTSSYVGGKTYITKIEPEIPGLIIENTVTSANSNSDNSYIYGAPYTYNRTIRGELPKGKTDYKVKGSMPDPALFLAQELKRNLIGEGLGVNGEATTLRILNDSIQSFDYKIITITLSPNLSDIVSILNTKSINLFAEHLLIETALKISGVNDTKSSADVIEGFWGLKGMDTSGMSMNDGSGLSYYNYINPKQLVFVLNYMCNNSKNFDVYYSSLPISGQTGTLRSVCVNTIADGKIHAKSGSIRKVRCYAGYTVSNSGREIAFAMMLNNFNCSDSNARKKLEKLMIAMVDLNI